MRIVSRSQAQRKVLTLRALKLFFYSSREFF
jgi:hypothetical protein